MSVCTHNFNFSSNFNVGYSVPEIPGYALEAEAIANGLEGGCYDIQMFEAVPNKPSLISRTMSCLKNYFNQQIGNIYPAWNKEKQLNSAKGHKALKKDAELAAPMFIKGCKEIAKKCGGTANFGPNDQFAIKSSGALKRRIISDSKAKGISIEESTRKTSDSLRGTIIIDSPKQAQSAVTEINAWVKQQNGTIGWKNFFQEERQDGYTGLHAKIALPFKNLKGEERTVLCELQVHFRSINDGTLNSTKERMRLLSKNTLPSLLSRAASKLSFLSGIASIGNICRAPEYLKLLCENTPPVDLCKDPVSNEICRKNLGIPRRHMPQLNSTVMTSFLKKKSQEGTIIEKKSIPTSQLTATQSEINRERVEGIIDSFTLGGFNPCENEIFTTSNRDGSHFIVDGHHRFAACHLTNGNQKTIVINKEIQDLLEELEEFPGVEHVDF